MRQVLFVISRSHDSASDSATVTQAALPGVKVEVFDLTVEAPDYDRLLTAIFAADSVQVW